MYASRWIRGAPEAFDAALKRRGLAPLSADSLALDARRREVQTALQALQTRRNDASKAIGEAKRKGDDAAALMAGVAGLKDQMAAAEEEERRLATELQDRLSGIPNAPLPEVPAGADESAKVCLRRDPGPHPFDFAAPEPYELRKARRH